MSRARGERPAGVYCMPLLPDLHVSLQWTRELMRGGRHRRTLVQLRFRLDDEETVWVGRFSGPHARATAAQAATWFMQPGHRDHEVILPRRIAAAEITSLAPAPPLIGWRYWPGSNGCPPLLRPGSMGQRQSRERLDRREYRQRRTALLRGLAAAMAAAQAAVDQALREELLKLDAPDAFDEDGAMRPELAEVHAPRLAAYSDEARRLERR
jgi:hypothetical protein